MLLLIDENVPNPVVNVFKARGHDIEHVVEDLAARTPDPIVASYASKHSRVIVTWNVKHYRRFLVRRGRDGELAYPEMGMIGFQCPEMEGAGRLLAHIDLIELEHQAVQQLSDKRLRVLIGFDWLQVFR